jgi:poly-gamma-glutamate capsule biosynthesis protein CapA/YwtB (metallophosphatase superfamily)
MLKVAPLLLALLVAGPARAVVLVAGGDVLLDRGVRATIAATGDPAALFRGLTPLVAGVDIVLANLECPLSTGGAVIVKPYMFCADPALAPALRAAGFTALSLANNHAYDAGREGFVETMDHLEAVGVLALGAGRNQSEACRARYVEADGGTVALLACVDLALEGLAPLDSLAGPARGSAAQFLAAVREARTHADWVVVTVHWGPEYAPFAHARQVDLAHRLAAAGVDVILGHHPHVIQPIEWIDGTIVIYSLGNLVFDANLPQAREALLARIRLVQGGPPGIEIIPLQITGCAPAAAVQKEAQYTIDSLERRSPGVRCQYQRDGWWRVAMEVPAMEILGK